MPNLTPFEIALLILGAVLIAALAAILWWRFAGDRVKALIAGWMALPLFWKIVLPVVFGAFVLHGSVKRGEVVGEGKGGADFSRVEQVGRVEGGEENVANGASVANSNFQFPIGNIGIDNWQHSHNGNILHLSSGQWGMPIVTDEDIARGYRLESANTSKAGAA